MASLELVAVREREGEASKPQVPLHHRPIEEKAQTETRQRPRYEARYTGKEHTGKRATFSA